MSSMPMPASAASLKMPLKRGSSHRKNRHLPTWPVSGHPEELQLIKLLAALPDTVDDSALHFEPHRLTYYLTELASCFHSFYNKNRVISEDQDT